MYAHEHANLSDELVAGLERIEEDLAGSIRIVSGAAQRNVTAGMAWGRALGHPNNDVVIVDYGAPEAVPFVHDRQYFGGLYEPLNFEPLVERAEYSVVVSDSTNRHINEPLFLVGERVIWTAHQLNAIDIHWSTTAGLLEELGEAIDLAIETRSIEQREQEQRQEALRHLTEYHRGASERRLGDLRSQISVHERALAGFQEHVALSIRDLRAAQRNVIVAEQQEDPSEDRIMAEWERLCDHPRITAVSCGSSPRNGISGSWLNFVTDDVTLTNPEDGESALMGRFSVTAALDAQTVRVENLDSPRGGRPHPHISESGGPCYGEMQTSISTVLIEGEYSAFVEYMFEFLETYNPRDDWGRYAIRWLEHPHDPDEQRQWNTGDEAVHDGLDHLVTEQETPTVATAGVTTPITMTFVENEFTADDLGDGGGVR